MTETLTAEQIAEGWILNDGKGPDDDKAFVQVYAPADGCELGQAEDFDFSFPSADDHDTDPIGSANNYFTRFVCDHCEAEEQSRALPETWFKIDVYTKQFASMKERHFCPTCGTMLAAMIINKPLCTVKVDG